MLSENIFFQNLFGLAEMLSLNLTEATAEIYYETLKKEFKDDEHFKQSIRNVALNWRYSYFPRPAQIIDAGGMSDDEIELLAHKAYQSAKNVAIVDGVYNSPDFQDKIINDVIDTLGGWKYFNARVAYIDSNDEKTKILFVRLYKQVAKNKTVRNVSLVGYARNPKRFVVNAKYEIARIELENDKKIAISNNTQVKSLVNKVRV